MLSVEIDIKVSIFESLLSFPFGVYPEAELSAHIPEIHLQLFLKFEIISKL
jgi:hypothetical protein